MVFSVTDFLSSPSGQVFDTLKKDDLIALGLHLGLDVKSSQKKQDIRIKVANKLVEENIFGKYDLPEYTVKSELESYKMSEFQYQVEL